MPAAVLMVLCGCESGPPKRAKEVRTITRDVPAVLRNTIGAEASLSGGEPIVVTGYGLVVGLNGTGSNDVPLPVRTYMVDQMTRMGVGKERGSLAGMSPEQLLDDPNTAVVVVQAVVPPGSPEGWVFDARVDAVPGTSTRSLEGGVLWTAELKRGIVSPAGPSTPTIATVYGPIFTNPFAKPGGSGIEPMDLRTGFILGGGRVTKPWPLLLLLDNPSHTRSRAMVQAVNARFPRGMNPKATARGVNEDSIEISIPAAYREKPEIFAALLKHTRIDQQFPEEMAQRYIDALKEQPELAEEMSWCLVALGELAIPYCRQLYSYPELRPRVAALQAGARLGDTTTRAHFEELINAGPSATRTGMIALLGELPADPKVSAYLRGLLDHADIDVRVAAYEALEKRNDGTIGRSVVAGKFQLHQVPGAEPFIYVTQSKTPRIVVFGDAWKISQPSFVSGWDGRLMVDAQESGGKVKVFYRDPRRSSAVTAEVEPSVIKFIRMLAQKPSPESPEPGLDLSYSQTVGALHVLVSGGGVAAPIVAEQDRLALELLRASQASRAEARAEFSEEGAVSRLGPATDESGEAPKAPVVKAELAGEAGAERALDPEREKRRAKYVVPLNPASGSAGKGKKN